MEKISVIIPAFNEEENIAKTIKLAKESKNVDEVLVVNNLSTDKTEEVSIANGERVVNCNEQGKGNAMEVGIQMAKNEIIIFLDADVKYVKENVVEKLCEPIIKKEVDFVKSSFDRTTGGTVTEVAVKPVLNLLYPNMYKFLEPISGMIASKKSILEKLVLEKDYGVDIGILLDVINQGYTVKEVNIGEIDNLSHNNKTNLTMSKMSTEILSAIFKRMPKK